MNTYSFGKNTLADLLQTSATVINTCSLNNGAIVAANSTLRHFPKDAKDYFFVWPRDASFICMAADVLGFDGIQELFFEWCFTRAEGFANTGLFFEKYYPQGLKAANRFQPDQTGTFLCAIAHHCKYKPHKYTQFQEIITLAANGICKTWNSTHFNLITNDIWEERLCFPDLEENFTYSLAACAAGLKCAYELLFDEHWKKVSEEMTARLDKHFSGYFGRSFGTLPDMSIDASTLGLVFPFAIYTPTDPKITSTINEIEQRLVTNGLLHRYEHDSYDGWMTQEYHRNKGAGGWPLLNFWMSIYYSLKGDKNKAFEYYSQVLNRLPPNGFIPEQLFDNNIQVSVSPLAWSHAMFILATEHLELMNN
jgi:GH15 family glucan-1,4-alpha-glucosidase